jgi:pimeloyl-[acyl-carrier protein] methyl ester esterase
MSETLHTRAQDDRPARASRLHVESAGAGPPLVLLHGFAMHGGLFAPLLPRLARRHRVHVVDLPGHGHSADVPVGSLAAIADRVADAIAALSPRGDAHGATTVLGWSFGGQVALEWARRRPPDVARLLLVCTTPSFVTRPHWTCAMDAATLRRFADELGVAYRLTLQRFLTLQVQGSEAGKATLAVLRARLFERGEPPPQALAATLERLLETDLRARVGDVVVPARVIIGTRDTLAPPAAGRWLARALPGADRVDIDGAAHVPFLSHPDAFDAAVQDFLDGD